MGAPELLQHLRGAGLVLTLTPAGALHVAPRSALTDDHRAAIRVERDALLLALQAEADQQALPASPRRTGDPLTTPEQGDEGRGNGWDDAKIDAQRDAEDELEAIEERAAILEFDAGLPRAVAEQRANGMEGTARLFSLQGEGARPRLLTKREADAAHAEPWSETVIAVFTARVQSLARRGLGQEDAEAAAERLHLRDLKGDKRRCCWECSHMGPTGHCLGRQRGRHTNPCAAPDELHGCPSFGLAKGLV